MRNFLTVLTCFATVVFAFGARIELTSKKTKDGWEKADGKDGRGVGGGYGGQIEDAFNGIGIDIDRIANGPRDLRDGKIFSSIPGYDDDTSSIELISEFLKTGNIKFVSHGDIMLGEGASFAIVDGVVYINQNVWEQKLLKEGYEVELIHILLLATNQDDPDMEVSKSIMEKIIALRKSLKTLEDYQNTQSIYD